MLSNLRVAVRPFVFVICLSAASAGTAFADGNYGGTDPPKPPGGCTIGANVQSAEDPIANAPSVWTRCLILAQWIAALN